MDRLTEFVSKSFDGQRKEESMENSSRKVLTSVDMSKETLDREALAARTSHDYDVDVDVTGDRDVTSEDVREPTSPTVTSPSTAPAGPATVTRDISRPTALAGISPSEALLHHRAAFLAHKDSALVSGLSQRHPFGIDSLSAKLQENAATQQERSPASSPPIITLPTSIPTCVGSSSVPSSMCNSVPALSLPYTRSLVSPPCSKGQF